MPDIILADSLGCSVDRGVKQKLTNNTSFYRKFYAESKNVEIYWIRIHESTEIYIFRMLYEVS